MTVQQKLVSKNWQILSITFNNYLIMSHSPCMSHKRSHEFMTWWILELFTSVDIPSAQVFKRKYWFLWIKSYKLAVVSNWHKCHLASWVQPILWKLKKILSYLTETQLCTITLYKLIRYWSTNNVPSKSTKKIQINLH